MRPIRIELMFLLYVSNYSNSLGTGEAKIITVEVYDRNTKTENISKRKFVKHYNLLRKIYHYIRLSLTI